LGASKNLVLLLGFAVGAIAANLYYAQPLIALISQSLGLAPEAAGLLVTFTQIGYGLGVLFLVPLADLLENRRLILSMLVLCTVSLTALAVTTQVTAYFIASLGMGLGASCVQIIVPYAAHLTPEATRGRVVGSLMSGLMLGIMLSRPTASLLTDFISWSAVFYFSAFLMVLLFALLLRHLPERKPRAQDLRYPRLIASMLQLFLRTPVLRRRALYQASLFGAFCVFWTASPLLLAGPRFHLSQTAIAIFALVGVSGAVAAPFSGRLADKGFSRAATTAALSLGTGSFLITYLFPEGSRLSLVFLVIAAILLDAAVSSNLVLGQRAIFSLRAKYRGRLNGLYVATIFVGGGVGSTLGAWAYEKGGWGLTAALGALMPALALIYFGTEWLTGFQKSRRGFSPRLRS
jgi:predicted MFS family arabinose efflux permease